MKCFFVRRKLVEYVETELDLPGATPLPDQIREAVETHLERCTGCREELEAIRDSLAAAETVAEVEPSAGFKLRTVGLLKEEAERLAGPVPLGLRLRPAFAYVVAIAVLGILVAVFLPESTERVELAGDIEEFEAEVDQYARDIEFLVGVLPGPDYEPASQVERAQLDRIAMLADSIEECWEALERNPENERVRDLLLAQMRQEVDALKSFYEVRSL
jgi:hypothetical protein